MKPVIRYKSQLLFRKSYKPERVIRIRAAPGVRFTIHPIRRFGTKPRIEPVP